MFLKPVESLKPNSLPFETLPLVNPAGFREYDARWIYEKEINLMGVQALGMGLGTLIHQMGVSPEVVTGHDYRQYSSGIKQALINGLMSSGIQVHDIGLALTPMAYFAQFDLGVDCVAMVTASHNENGWTGVKMGAGPPLTFGQEEMERLRELVLSAQFVAKTGGSYQFHEDIGERYLADLVDRPNIQNPLKAVVACGNGTAGAFAPHALERLGVEVVRLDCELDHAFPNYNPNPEDLEMLRAIQKQVLASGADVGIGFDGDGDRCGVVDNEGEFLFADKLGVLLARDFSADHENSQFVVDVKSTGLFANDPILKKNGAHTHYYKTGHSHIKRRVNALGALAGFEKSGHYFLNTPLGRGYDDGLLSAVIILQMMDKNYGKTLADLRRSLGKTWGSPTLSAQCADKVKYDVIDRVTRRIKAQSELGGVAITSLTTINGIRVETCDGTWGLARASSNKPEIVVVVESPVSETRMRQMFEVMDTILHENPEVGTYNQTF
ncbi:phosphomannomutase/phosphoglucomutase [Flexibacterium corallicola]|uniref:phosphomannomutase/phosphoglucomutase n=1 Tax=Flexibacterium corallicola TaxID=3037259 RepID=UPI00286ECAA4|nr:phosphomannomutase/phosphoglucomutase [Pseudovibrio sp. M1P-2-3]